MGTDPAPDTLKCCGDRLESDQIHNSLSKAANINRLCSALQILVLCSVNLSLDQNFADPLR
jgi:hypothetical protein